MLETNTPELEKEQIEVRAQLTWRKNELSYLRGETCLNPSRASIG